MLLKRLRGFVVIQVLVLAGCATLDTEAQALANNIAKNATAIANYCNKTIIPDLNNPIATAVAGVSTDVASAIAGAKVVCAGITTAAQSISTLPWLQTIDTIINSGGKTLPPPVAPAPVTATSVIPSV